MTETTAKTYARETAIATGVLAVVATLAACYFGRVVFMPIVLALMLTTVFRPIVHWLERARVPPPVSAPLLILGLLVIIAGAVRNLAPAVQGFATQLPQAVDQARDKLRTLPAPFNGLAQAIPSLHAVAPALSNDSTPRSTPAASPAQAQRSAATGNTATPDTGPLIGRVFGTATELLTGTLQTLLLLIFFLAGGSSWRKRMGRSRGAAAVAEVGEEVQSCVAHYLRMTTLINIAQGAAVGLATWAIGFPAPVIWGVLTFVAEFFPYLGGITMVTLLTLVGFATTHGTGHALLGPILYLVITTVQNNVVSPVVYGRGLELNPAAILISVIIWWFVWGAAGAFLAVPILATLRIVCDRQGGALTPLARMMGS